MSGAGYQIGSLDTEFPIETHQSYGNEVQFHFKYAPSIAPAMVFEDLEVVELNHDTHIESLLNAQDTHLELEMQQKFMSEFDFIDDDVQKEINNISQKHKKSAF